jgi:hypothetical protein
MDKLCKILDNLLIEEKIKILNNEIQKLKRTQHTGLSYSIDFNWQVNTINGWIPYDEITNIKLELLLKNGINNKITYRRNGRQYIINIETMRQIRLDNSSLYRTVRRVTTEHSHF